MNLIYDTNMIQLHRFLFLLYFIYRLYHTGCIVQEISQIKILKKRQTYDR